MKHQIKLLCFVLGLLAWATSTWALGRPAALNFSPRDFDGDHRNWAVIQGTNGMIYAGNATGVLQYDGVSWRAIPVPNDIVRSLASSDTGTIFVGGVDEIGLLSTDDLGRTRYVSLVDNLPTADRTFGDIWVIKTTSETVYFQSWQRIFKWQLDPAGGVQPETLQIWRPDTAFGALVQVGDDFYIQQQGIGLTRLVGETFELIPGGDFFRDANIVDELDFVSLMFPRGDDLLIVNIRRGLFIADGETIRPLSTEADHILSNAYNNLGVELDDGSLAIGTYRAGLMIIDRDGSYTQFSSDNGLVNDSIHGVALDASGGIWMAHKGGLSRLAIPSPASIYGPREGLFGTVNDMTEHRGTLFVSTTESVFALTEDGFRAVAGIELETYGLLSTPEALIASTVHGVFEIRGRKAERVLTVRAQSHIEKYASSPITLMLGIEEGMSLLQHDNNGWFERSRLNLGSGAVNQILNTGDGTLWLRTSKSGVLLRLQLTEELEVATLDSFHADHGLPKSSGTLAAYDGDIYFVSVEATYRFNPSSNTFVPTTGIGEGFDLATDNEVILPFEDSSDRIWLGQGGFGNQVRAVFSRAANGEWKRSVITATSLDLSVWTTAFRDQDGVFWFGGTDGLLRYDAEIEIPTELHHPVLIRRFTVGDGTELPTTGLQPTIDYSDNRVRIEYALPDYSNPDLNRYQIMLEGLENRWSAWTSETLRDYTNLREGTYHFRVRGRNAFGEEGGEVSFRFEIKPPWYRTWWAYLLYFVVLGTTGPSIYFVRVRQLQKQQRDLENLVEFRTSELKERNRFISEQAEMLEHLARTDPLTNLANRRSMLERLKLEAARVERGTPTFCLALADVDNFKSFNDQHGHDCGDTVLTTVAETMAEMIRDQDLLARWGGEEFLLLLPETDVEEATQVAERLRTKIELRQIEYNGVALSVTLSFGVALFDHEAGIEAAIKTADAAMYVSKQRGRNMVSIGAGEDREG